MKTITIWNSQGSGALSQGKAPGPLPCTPDQGRLRSQCPQRPGARTPTAAQVRRVGWYKTRSSSQGFKKPARDLSHQAKQMLLSYYISKFWGKTIYFRFF